MLFFCHQDQVTTSFISSILQENQQCYSEFQYLQMLNLYFSSGILSVHDKLTEFQENVAIIKKMKDNAVVELVQTKAVVQSSDNWVASVDKK